MSTEKGRELHALRQRVRPYTHQPSRREVQRLAIQEEEMALRDEDRYEAILYGDNNYEDYEPTDEDLEDIEIEYGGALLEEDSDLLDVYDIEYDRYPDDDY